MNIKGVFTKQVKAILVLLFVAIVGGIILGRASMVAASGPTSILYVDVDNDGKDDYGVVIMAITKTEQAGDGTMKMWVRGHVEDLRPFQSIPLAQP